MKATTVVKIVAFAVVGALGTETASAQASGTYSGSGTPYHFSLGATYRFNLGYAHSYVGFNIKPENYDWTLATDGANNGGSMIVGDLVGGLRIITVPATGGTNPNTLTDGQLLNLTRFMINRYGQVQIGVQLPSAHSDYKLSVDGKLVAKSIYVTTANWADFVFAPTYKRMPLAELETYLQRNQHLPALPSAGEVAAQGYNVSEMDAKLLQTVEELTLHVIALSKQVQVLEASKRGVKGRTR